MNKTRLEAFSDGVLAIIITVMVIEIHKPKTGDLDALLHLLPTLLAYVMSFIYVGIYWNNHHHMFHAADRVSGGVLWANLHLLFWLSLIPFTTAWMGANHHDAIPVATYGAVLLASGAAYGILAKVLVWHHGKQSRLAQAFGSDRKGWASVALYAVAVPLAFVEVWASYAIYIAVAAIWLIPDRRVERVLHK